MQKHLWFVLFSYLEYQYFVWNTKMCRYIFWELNFLIAVLHVLHVPAKMGARQQWWPSPSTHIRELYCGFWEGPAPERCTTTESNTTTPASSSPVSWKRGWQRNAKNSLRWRMESFVLLISAVGSLESFLNSKSLSILCPRCVDAANHHLKRLNHWCRDILPLFFPPSFRRDCEATTRRRANRETLLKKREGRRKTSWERLYDSAGARRRCSNGSVRNQSWI